MIVMRMGDGAFIGRHRTLPNAQRTSLVDGTNARQRRTLLPVHKPGGSMGHPSTTRSAARRTTFTIGVVTLLLAALTFGATSRQSSSSQPGVTKDEIKVGIPLVDFEAIKDFVAYDSGAPEAIRRVFVNKKKKTGGRGGRKLGRVKKKSPPIPGGKPDPLSLCTSFTED